MTTLVRSSSGAYAAAARRLAGLTAFAIAPVVLVAFALVTLAGHGLSLDFHASYWPAADRVLHGITPYAAPSSPEVAESTAFVYPALGALLFVPFGLLPHGVADAVFVALCIATVPVLLALLGVRDWRVFGIAFLWQPVFSAWETANVMLLLALGIALLWRSRDRPFAAGLLLTLLVSVKLFIWPLAIWLLATRRYAALGYAVVCGVALNAAAWAVLGFDQIGRYVKLLSAVSAHEEGRSYSVLALALDAGATRTVAYALALALAAAVGAACFVLGRRARDVPALLLAVATALLATPIIWTHYFVLLIVPLALLRPRLDIVWALPIAIVLCPTGRPLTWQLVFVLVTVATMIVVAARPSLARLPPVLLSRVRAGAPREIAEHG
jgi:hypothetical protein